MDFFKIVCAVIIGVLLAIHLKGIGSPIWLYLSMTLCLVVFFYIMNRLGFVLDFLRDLLDEIGIEPGYFEILLKILGISYLCEFATNICKESGFMAVAGQIEIGGKITMLVISMPILMAVVRTITGTL